MKETELYGVSSNNSHKYLLSGEHGLNRQYRMHLFYKKVKAIMSKSNSQFNKLLISAKSLVEEEEVYHAN